MKLITYIAALTALSVPIATCAYYEPGSAINPIQVEITPSVTMQNSQTESRLKSTYGLNNYYSCYRQSCTSGSDYTDPYIMQSCLTMVSACLERKQLTQERSCSVGYLWDDNSGRCITYDQHCQNSYGVNSEYNGVNSSGQNSCRCKAGYQWQDSQNICVKKPLQCAANASPVNDQCVCNTGYMWSGGQCVTLTQSCKNQYGPVAISLGLNESNNNLCDCMNGYTWNEPRTDCVPVKQPQAEEIKQAPVTPKREPKPTVRFESKETKTVVAPIATGTPQVPTSTEQANVTQTPPQKTSWFSHVIHFFSRLAFWK